MVISSNRGKRPQDFKEEIEKPAEDKKDDCPFCKGNEGMTPPTIFQIPEDDWQVRLFENKFEALNEEDKFEAKKETELHHSWKSYGRHEVLVETPDHDQKFHNYSQQQVDYYFKAVQRRYSELKEKEGIENVAVFRNIGKKGGASLKHVHTQLVASPVALKHIKEEKEASKKYWKEQESCPYCDVVETEREGKRTVIDSKNFFVICPYASVWPYETSIVPKKHRSGLSDFSQEELSELGRVMRDLMSKYNTLFEEFPYNTMFFSFPQEKYTHFHLDTYPRLKTQAGLEYLGLPINEVSPERAARELKEA